MTRYKKDIGRTGEQLATSYLQRAGYTILDKNYETPVGEIDIVAQKDNKIHFIEVKTRSNLKKGYPHEAVGYHKLRHFERAIQFYLLKKALKNYKMSLDVVSIILETETIKHFQGVPVKHTRF